LSTKFVNLVMEEEYSIKLKLFKWKFHKSSKKKRLDSETMVLNHN
jgi:hypothetical protein